MDNRSYQGQEIHLKSDVYFLPSENDSSIKQICLDNQPDVDSNQQQIVISKQEKLQSNAVQTYVHKQQQKIIQSQQALADHYLQLTQAIKQIQTQVNSKVEEQFGATKLNSQQSRSMIKNPSTNSLGQSQIQEIKGNVKNAYIKKITSLLNFRSEKNDQQEDSSSDEQSNGDEQRIYKSLRNKGILGSTQDLVSLEEKNMKLKESAKNSRLRKKVYITMLENKIQEIQLRMQRYRTGIADSIKFVESVVVQNDSICSLIVGQNQIQQQLDHQKMEDEEGLQLLLDSYSMRFGAAGVKRKQYIRYCFMNLGRLLLQSNYGALLLADGENKTRSDEFNDYVKEFKSVCNITDENITYKLLGPINNLLDHKNRHEKLIQNVSKEYNKLIKSQIQLEAVVSDINQVLTPQQQAILLEECCNQDLVPRKKVCL